MAARPESTEVSRAMRRHERTITGEFRLKRLQRGVEYALLSAVHLFFVLSFHDYLEWWMAAALGLTMFCLNFQLTQLRERRRTREKRNRGRILGDTFESILLLMFIVLLSLGGLVKRWLAMGDQEFLGYVAAVLAGMFLAGLLGEFYWQLRHFGALDGERRLNYIRNLRRTIIFPYLK
jgi:hypothetical protein